MNFPVRLPLGRPSFTPSVILGTTSALASGAAPNAAAVMARRERLAGAKCPMLAALSGVGENRLLPGHSSDHGGDLVGCADEAGLQN